MGKDYSKILFISQGGIPVFRAAQADPQNVWETIFTVTGGPIRILSLIGVRTVIQAGGASNMQFRHSVGPTTICGAAAITGNAVGTIYSITGIFADNLIIGAAGIPVPGDLGGSQGGGGNSIRGILVGAGNIQVTMTAAAGTGSTRYILRYIPEDDESSVVAA